jgi:hypothetical protein
MGRCKGCTTGDVLKICAAFRPFLPPFGLITLFGSIPGWPARSGSFELGTSRVVDKEGERGEAKVSSSQIRLRTWNIGDER